MNLFYRISDASHARPRLCDKWVSLLNFCETMVRDSDDFHVISDHCAETTVKRIERVLRGSVACNWSIEKTQLGNSGSFLRALARVSVDAGTVYFCEDDYLHLPTARDVIEEGLEGADFVSAYDHRDKYMDPVAGGNQFVQNGGEVTRVVLTNSSHFKVTNSTCMTFGAKASALQRFRQVMIDYCDRPTPRDFEMWLAIRKLGGSLISPIPGQATHCEPHLLAPLIDWQRLVEETMMRLNMP